MRELISLLARSATNVLVLGEIGVGKKHLGEAIHKASDRAGKPFLCLNCATLSNVFMHEVSEQVRLPRVLEIAEGGTLFLDEIGALTPELQARMIQILDVAEASAPGSKGPRLRVISSTGRDLRRDIARERFRHDLYVRLNGTSVRIPPLRERKPDVRTLVDDLMGAFQASDPGRPALYVSDRAIECLESYSWPGNVRELRRTLERAVLLSDNGIVEPHHLGSEIVDQALRKPSVTVDLNATTDERQKIQYALSQTAGNQTHAAALLGISRATFVRRLDEYALPRPRNAHQRRIRSAG